MHARVRRLVVVANPHAGPPEIGLSRMQRIQVAFREAGLDARVELVPGKETGEAVRRSVKDGAEAVIVAGGDGTLGAAAGALAGTDVPLGVLAYGTLNHFARDLAIPLDLAGAVRLIKTGSTRRVDVASVNGHAFINNSSIGVYPRMVRRRDEQIIELGRGKWLAALLASGAVLRRYPVIGARIETDREVLVATTPFLFVGNNAYEMGIWSMGRRATVSAGQLSVYVTTPLGRLGLVRLAARALAGRLRQERDFRTITTRRVVVDAAPPLLRVAVDGEVHQMTTPLEFTTRPGALRVFAPGGAA